MKEIFDLLVEEELQDKIIEIIYINEQKKMVSELELLIKSYLKDKYTNSMHEYIYKLQKEENFSDFLNEYCEHLFNDFNDNNSYYKVCYTIIKLMSVDVFLKNMSIAMKISIGMKNKNNQISTDAFLNVNHKEQQKYLNYCIDGFNSNICRIQHENDVFLQQFLHKIRSNNKRKRTQKKNLNRVYRRTKKLMIVARNSKYGEKKFSNHTYQVPEIFKNYLIKCYF